MTAASTRPKRKKKSADATEELIALALQTLEDAKAVDIVRIDASGRALRLFDTLLICTATSNRHANALTERLRAAIKGGRRKIRGVEGPGDMGWTLLDLGDVMVHIFLSEAREHYDLESLWNMAEDA